MDYEMRVLYRDAFDYSISYFTRQEAREMLNSNMYLETIKVLEFLAQYRTK